MVWSGMRVADGNDRHACQSRCSHLELGSREGMGRSHSPFKGDCPGDMRTSHEDPHPSGSTTFSSATLGTFGGDPTNIQAIANATFFPENPF
jgi:hypothetical protein